MERDLEGKTALVTGGARGIGRAIAERLAAAGAVVAVNYASNTHLADDTVAAIAKAGGQAFLIRARIGAPGAIETLVAELDAGLTRRVGSNRLDILINNIGGGEYGTVADTSAELLDQTWSNNIRGPFLLTQALLDRLADFGRVVNISSAGARIADPSIAAYALAKAALENFTISLAKTLGPRGITVNSVAPGFTDGETNRAMHEGDGTYEAQRAMTALARIGQPEEIADFVHALASAPGRWITGQNIDASGGYRL